MEIISGVASAFAVVSLSVQLLDKIHGLCEFWDKVQGAPKYILDLVQELRLLEAVIKEINQKELEYGLDPMLTSILQSVSVQMDELLAIMAKNQVGLSSDSRIIRTWNSFKVSLKSSQIMQFRLSLSETKATLVLARFNLSEKIHARFHEQTMTAITTGFTNLTTQTVSGTVSTETHDAVDVQGHVESLQTEMRRVTAGVPQSWIQSGMRVAIDKAVHGMANKLSTEDVTRRSDQNGADTRPGDTSTSRGYSNPGSDTESARDSARLREESRNRRVRHLGANKFHGTYSSITSSVFGTIYLHTNKFYVEDLVFAEDSNGEVSSSVMIETHFTFYPNRWLMWWGLKYGFQIIVSKDGASWKNSLQTFHAVPDNALIFEFCKQGNVMAVNSLFASGQASPWDTNSKGWTPLHVASWHCNTALIKTLLRAGSNRQALTFDFPSGNYEQCSPLVTAATITSTISIPPHQRIEALRLLISDVEFSDQESQAWKMVLVLLERERACTGLCTTTQVSEWVLDRFLAGLRASHSPQLVAWLITFSLESVDLLRRVLDLDKNAVHASVIEGGYTPMHGGIAENFSDAVLPGIEELLKNGADPHRVGMTSSSYGGDDSERMDTPTSLAMRRSSAFWKWRHIIRNLGYDIQDFVSEEMTHAPLVALGWTVGSLLKLFELDFTPLELEPDLCTQCRRVVYHTFDDDEIWWEHLLEEIKAEGTSLDAGYQSNLDEDERDAIQDDDAPLSVSSTTSTESSQDVDLCWKCGIMQRIYGEDYERGRL